MKLTPQQKTLEHKGETYYNTGKTGTRIPDGIKGIEFASTKGNGKRLWVYTDGSTLEEIN
jgi:hypothetical protein